MADESTIEPMLTPRQVALMFSVDPKTVSRWARSGRLAATKTPGGHHRFKEADVKKAMAADDAAGGGAAEA
jgi:excisionase family DNA binding protein